MRLLSVLRGPSHLKTEYPLNAEHLTLGSEAGSDICVESGHTPPFGVLFSCEGDETYLNNVRDFGGVYVNNIELTEPARRRLRHGDVIKVGEVLLEYRDATSELTKAAVELSDEHGAAIHIHSDSMFQKTEFPSASNVELKLRILLDFFFKLETFVDAERATVEVLDALLDLFPGAGQAVVVLREDGTAILPIVRQRSHSQVERFSISRTVFETVVQEKGNLLVSTTFGRSEMWAPVLDLDGNAKGAVMLSAHRLNFTDDDLRVFGLAVRILSYRIAAARL